METNGPKVRPRTCGTQRLSTIGARLVTATEGCWKYQNSHYCCNELSCLIAPSMKDSWLFREPSIQQSGSPPTGNCKPAGSIAATASDQTGRCRWGRFQSEWTGSPNRHPMNGDFSAIPRVLHQGHRKSLGLVGIKTVIIINHKGANDSKESKKHVCVSGTLLGFFTFIIFILRAKLWLH